MTRLLIAASGTGGHVFPALAVTESLPADWKLHWLGVPDRMEIELVPRSIPLHTVRAGGLQGRGLSQLINLARLTLATVNVAQLIHKQGIEMVFTTGGYIAAPAILAARLCRIPVVLHESNGVPGRVTRLLGHLCDHVALGFDQAATRLARCNVTVTGTPVRGAFLAPAPLPDWVPRGTGPLLLIIGGSQGAVGLNNMVRPLVNKLLEAGCRIVHLTGAYDQGRGIHHHGGYVELPFSDEMPGLMQHSDLAISRAGAGTISELLACECPAVFVPFPQATDHHQEVNANAVAAGGAAVLVLQHQSDHPALEQILWRLLGPRLRSCTGELDPINRLKSHAKKMSQGSASTAVKDLLEKTFLNVKSSE